MIKIKKKEKCCGCEACIQKCPKQCITFHEDHEGFRYPSVIKKNCIHCGLCEKVCPVTHQATIRTPIAIYGAKNQNEQVREISSSGGIFTLLSERTLQKGGIVFGAKFNSEWEVEHGYTETVEGLALFRGSKYVQSRIGNSFKNVESFLEEGREVLFSGVSCQIAALNLYLGREYDNLLTVEIICHSVPSPKIWRKYLTEVIKEHAIKEKSKISAISFKNKCIGWKKPSFTLYANKKEIIREIHWDNYYMHGFLSSLYTRPSCAVCPAKSLKSKSDIATADFWGIEHILPEFEDKKGVSLVMINSNKGANLYEKLYVDSYMLDIDVALNSQRAIKNSFKHHYNRDRFYRKIEHADSLQNLILDNLNYISPIMRIKKLIKKILNRL